MTEFFTAMSSDEFYDYLYSAYTNTDDEDNFTVPEDVSLNVSTLSSIQTVVTQSTQRYYYSSTNSYNYFYATANWVSVDGANHYTSYVSAGISGDSNAYHYALLSIDGYSFSNSMQEMTVDYHYTTVSAYGIQQGNYYTSITYYAGVNTY